MTTQNSAGLALSEPVRAFLGRDHGLVIDGEVGPARSGQVFEVRDPATGAVVARVARGGADDVSDAVASAKRAFDDGRWQRMPPARRAEILWRVADLLEARAEEFAELETVDVGRPLPQSRGMVAGSVTTFRYYAGWPTKLYGSVNPVGEGALGYTVHEPAGVVGAIAPWNGPLAVAAAKIAPSLAAGNTVVVKPAEEAPLSTLWLAELLLEAGVPPGVVNVVPGLGAEAGVALVEHPDVPIISFTGSTDVGKEIHRRVSERLKRVNLELGGKTPNIVFADADLDAAARAATSVWSNSGQVCFAGTRLLVQRAVAAELTERVAARSADLRIGPGLDPSTDVGPLISATQQERVGRYLELGRTEGANVVLGGHVPDRPGYFVEPTIFSGVRNHHRIAQDEIFGPVLSILEFDDDDDALSIANDSRYGLAAAVWTKDITRAHRAARRLQAGTVWINAFGVLDRSFATGGFKESGIGREHGTAWIDEFTETKSVYVGLGG